MRGNCWARRPNSKFCKHFCGFLGAYISSRGPLRTARGRSPIDSLDMDETGIWGLGGQSGRPVERGTAV